MSLSPSLVAHQPHLANVLYGLRIEECGVGLVAKGIHECPFTVLNEVAQLVLLPSAVVPGDNMMMTTQMLCSWATVYHVSGGKCRP